MGFGPSKDDGRKKIVSIKNMDIAEVQDLLVSAAKRKVDAKKETYRIEEKVFAGSNPSKRKVGKKRDLKTEFRTYLKSILNTQKLEYNNKKLNKITDTFFAKNTHIWHAF